MNEEIFVNPYTAIRLFARTYLAYRDTIFTDRKYKITREAWIASMFLIGLGKNTSSDWWLTPVKNDGSPDFRCCSFTRNTKGNFTNISTIKLEVFEWRKEQNENDFLEAIKKIKLKKIIDPQITLVCYIRRSNLVPPAVLLNSQIKDINPKVKDIWYLGDVTGDAKTWRITQIFPNTLAIDIDYDSILKTKEIYSFIHAYMGKTEKLEYEPTDKKVLLTPEFNIIVEDNNA